MQVREAAGFIDGGWIAPGDGRDNVNPSDTRDIIGTFGELGADAVDDAVNAARAALPSWASATPETRADVLDTASQLLMARSAELGRLLSREEGKTLAEGIGEVTRAARIIRFMAGECYRMQGEFHPSARPDIDIDIRRQPVGVVGLITPWNFPIAIPAWKIAPALAFGNTVVLKPAEATPALAVALVEVLVEAGVPDGVVNLVIGRGSVVGDAMARHPGIAALSFTGSVPTGRNIARTAAETMKKLQMEMGGKNPLVVMADADIDAAVAAALNGAYFATGQRCTASSRLIVDAAIHDAFVERLGAGMRALKVGHALADGTQIGPVIDERQLASNLDYVAAARSEGAAVTGGERLERDTPGWFMAPALCVGTKPTDRINREEVFGPVASVIKVDGFDEALAVANDTEFGLSAGIFTRSLAHARAFKEKAEAGMVMVNLPTAGSDYHVPFGGRKASSFGPREQGSYALEFYTTVKVSYTH